MTKNKCACKVQIYGLTRNRSCKGAVYININNINYCWSHAKKNLGSSAIIIQSVTRGMICRKKIKNLFINLPDEIKNIVLFYIRQDYYYKKYKNLTSKIIEKKINNINNLLIPNFLQNQHWLSPQSNDDNRINFIKSLLNIYNIFINNWNNINFDMISSDNLIKLYMLSFINIWGKTTWNGIDLTNLFNTINDIDYQLMQNFENLLKNFKLMWKQKFEYIRTSPHIAIINIL